MSQSLFDSDAFNRALFFPRPDAAAGPPGAEDLFVEVRGARLHLRLHRAAAATSTTLLFHGNGEVVADYDGLAEAFLRFADAALAVVDFRGYGRSTGVPTLRDALEDAPRVVEAARAAAGARPLVVMGRSLGAACAAEVVRAGPAAEAFVFESAASDLRGVVRRRGLDDRRITDEDLARFDPLPKLACCRVPALVLHGEADALIPVEEARATFAALSGTERRLVTVPGRGHNDLHAAPRLWEALGHFVKEVASRRR